MIGRAAAALALSRIPLRRDAGADAGWLSDGFAPLLPPNLWDGRDEGEVGKGARQDGGSKPGAGYCPPRLTPAITCGREEAEEGVFASLSPPPADKAAAQTHEMAFSQRWSRHNTQQLPALGGLRQRLTHPKQKSALR